MLTAVHTLIYSDDPEATRTFFVDVLQWPHLDSGGGWLMFKTGPSELGVHPTSGGEGEGAWTMPRAHEVTLMADDLDATMTELAARGATFISEVEDAGFGRTVRIAVPGAGDMMIYQPKHPTAYTL